MGPTRKLGAPGPFQPAPVPLQLCPLQALQPIYISLLFFCSTFAEHQTREGDLIFWFFVISFDRLQLFSLFSGCCPRVATSTSSQSRGRPGHIVKKRTKRYVTITTSTRISRTSVLLGTRFDCDACQPRRSSVRSWEVAARTRKIDAHVCRVRRADHSCPLPQSSASFSIPQLPIPNIRLYWRSAALAASPAPIFSSRRLLFNSAAVHLMCRELINGGQLTDSSWPTRLSLRELRGRDRVASSHFLALFRRPASPGTYQGSEGAEESRN